MVQPVKPLLAAVLLLLTPSWAWAGATVWVPNGASSAPADSAREPLDPASKSRYPAWNAIDGDPKTTFVVVKGEALRLDLGGRPKIHHIELVPGYAKDPKVWAQNRRATKVRVRTQLDGTARAWKTVTFDPPQTLGPDLPWQSITLEPALPADTIEIEVLESSAGPKTTSKDICISEIILLTRDNQPPFAPTYVFSVPLSDDRLAMPFERFRLQGPRCLGLEHDNTGGAKTVFVGACRVSGPKLQLNGKLEIRDSVETEVRPLKASYPFRRVNPRVVLVGGYVYSR